MAKKGGISWLLNLILTIIPGVGIIWQAFRRATKFGISLRSLVWGFVWFITAGLFAIGWIIDIVCVILYKDIKILAKI